MNFFPTTLSDWIGVAIIAVPLSIAGMFALFGIFDKTRRERNKMNDDADDRLINLLQQTVGELEKKVNQADDDIKGLTKEIEGLKAKNQTLMDVLQGKDNVTQEFYKQAYDVFGVAKETNGLVKQTNVNIEKLISLMNEHLKVIESKV